MTGPQILIAAIIIALVIAFIVTMLFVNAQTSKIIDSNVKLAESQNTLLTQNKTQTDLLEKLEEQTASQQRELDELYKRLEGQQDKMTELRQQTRGHRQAIKATQDMNDEELMAWIDERMDEARLYTTPTLRPSNDLATIVLLLFILTPEKGDIACTLSQRVLLSQLPVDLQSLIYMQGLVGKSSYTTC